MSNIYLNGEYIKNNPDYHSEDSAWKAEKIFKLIQNNKIKYKSISEAGCGVGLILKNLQEKSDKDIRFYGFDISPHAINKTNKIQNEKLNFYCEDITQKENFHSDILLCIDVFEHVDDYTGFLRKLKDKAEYKIFHIPLDLSVQTILRASPILKYRKEVGHLHYFTKETALETLKYSGYEVIDRLYTPWSLELKNKSFKQMLMRIPRKFFLSINSDLCVRIFGGCSLLVLAK